MQAIEDLIKEAGKPDKVNFVRLESKFVLSVPICGNCQLAESEEVHRELVKFLLCTFPIVTRGVSDLLYMVNGEVVSDIYYTYAITQNPTEDREARWLHVSSFIDLSNWAAYRLNVNTWVLDVGDHCMVGSTNPTKAVEMGTRVDKTLSSFNKPHCEMKYLSSSDVVSD